MDRSFTRQAGGAGVVLRSLEGDEVECIARLDCLTTNNKVEYKALIVGLDLAKVEKAMNVVVYCNTQVVTNQINGNYECKGERMKKYFK